MDEERLAWHAELKPSACPKSLSSQKGSFCERPSLMGLTPDGHCLPPPALLGCRRAYP